VCRASVIIAVYNAIRELRLVLTGYSRQSFRDFEVVIADDGSGPEMAEFLDEFASTAPFPIRWVSQPDDGFRKCRILNQAIRVSRAPYLIFADADCIPHRRFVEAHVRNSRPDTVFCGRRVKLADGFSKSLTPLGVLAGRLERHTAGLFLDWLRGRVTLWEEGIEIRNRKLASWLHRSEPVLFGCNYSVPKSLIEQVNGFNEDFVYYWGEDVELQHRMKLAGADIRWIRHQAIQYHLHHVTRSENAASHAVLDHTLAVASPQCRNGLQKDCVPVCR
jgi:glycosyltransferase involved in cell wall biosynthesis